MEKYNTEYKFKLGQETHKEVYRFILKYYRRHRYMPCTREITDALELSTDTVRRHINMLMDDGVLVSEHPKEQRAYRLAYSKVVVD